MTAFDARANKPINPEAEESIGSPGNRPLMTKTQGAFMVVVAIVVLAVVAWMNSGDSTVDATFQASVETGSEQPAAKVSKSSSPAVEEFISAAEADRAKSTEQTKTRVFKAAMALTAAEKSEIFLRSATGGIRSSAGLDDLGEQVLNDAFKDEVVAPKASKPKAKPKAEPKPIEPAPAPVEAPSPAYTRGEGLPPSDATQFGVWLRRRQDLLTRDFERSYKAELDGFGWLSRKSLEWSYGPNWKSKFETAVKVVGRDALWTAATPLAIGCYLDVETETDLQMADNLFNYRLLENQSDLVETIYDAIVAHVDRMEETPPIEVKVEEKVVVPGTSEEEAPLPAPDVTVA